jgi:hypothetical protein
MIFRSNEADSATPIRSASHGSEHYIYIYIYTYILNTLAKILAQVGTLAIIIFEPRVDTLCSSYRLFLHLLELLSHKEPMFPLCQVSPSEIKNQAIIETRMFCSCIH